LPCNTLYSLPLQLQESAELVSRHLDELCMFCCSAGLLQMDLFKAVKVSDCIWTLGGAPQAANPAAKKSSSRSMAAA
jgi:hypothetical protein